MTTTATDRKVTRAEQRDRSTSAIMATAIRLFAERGYDAVSLDDIAADAEVKRTLILYYYQSKEKLWRLAASQVATAFNDSLSSKIARAGGVSEEERMSAVLAASLDAFLEQPNFPRFLVREGGRPSARLRWLVERFGYADISYGSAALQEYLGNSIMRDVLFAILLSMAALGPLMEASLSRASGRRRPGVHPMTKHNRDELVQLMTRFIASVDAADKSGADGRGKRAP